VDGRDVGRRLPRAGDPGPLKKYILSNLRVASILTTLERITFQVPPTGAPSMPLPAGVAQLARNVPVRADVGKSSAPIVRKLQVAAICDHSSTSFKEWYFGSHWNRCFRSCQRRPLTTRSYSGAEIATEIRVTILRGCVWFRTAILSLNFEDRDGQC
jgi:hypothetical protein